MKAHAQKQSQPTQEASPRPNRLTQRTTEKQAVSGGVADTNAEARKVIQPGAPPAATPATTGLAPDFSLIPAHSKESVKLQRKLTVHIPGDIYEQEADRVAERVTSMPEPQLQRACACNGGGCPACRSEHADQERLQTKRVQPNASMETTAPPIVHEVLRSSGQPLDATTRAFMEPRFGYDFSHVRVHTDTSAANAASAITARAFTVNRDIVFGAGEYAPQTQSGRRLLSHELTHVVQQGAGVHLNDGTDTAGDPYQRHSDAVASVSTNAGRMPSWLSPGTRDLMRITPTVQRKKSTEAGKSPEPTRESPPELQTGDSDGGCTFKLKVEGIEYCFVANEVSRKGKYVNYTLKAHAINTGGEKTLSYTVDVQVYINDNGTRLITSPVDKIIKMIGPDKKSIDFDPLAIVKAWDAQWPVGQQSPWHFVVLEVYDKEKKILPTRKVFWMGGDWEKLRADTPVTPGKKVATFRVERREVQKEAAKNNPDINYLESNIEKGLEVLEQKQVRLLIQNKEPTQTSDTGFDIETYVGMKVKTNLVDVAGSKSKIPWDKAAGRMLPNVPGQEPVFWVSDPIPAPPNQIEAHFKSNGSDVPGDLEGTSLAQFKDQVRLVLLYLQDTPELNINIHAYTDTVGTPEKNCMLSQARAESAKKYLTDTTIWTGVGGIPKALDDSRIKMVQGEGQTLAEEDLKKSDPKNWKKIIGTEGAQKLSFRRFEITYSYR